MIKQMRVGIDFGNTIVRKVDGVQTVFDGAMDTIAEFVKWGVPVYIISKVDEQQKIEVSDWLRINEFFQKTGVPAENLYFCEHRHQKGSIAIKLGLTHHVDDRTEVMTSMPFEIRKYLFNPRPEEVMRDFNFLVGGKIALLTDWKMVSDVIRHEWFRVYGNQK